MSNRQARRAQAAATRKLRSQDPNNRAVQALMAEFAQANEALQRHNTYLEYATRAAANASAIAVIALPEGHEAIEGDPNWERTKLIAEATAKIEVGKANLAAAFLDACDLLAKLDEPVSDIQVVPANVLTNLRG